MLFNTPQFVMALLPFLLLWYLTPNALKKPLLLVVNYLFAYMLGGMPTVIVLGTVTIAAWIFAKMQAKKSNNARFLCVVSVMIFVGILAFFKYVGYFSELLIKISNAENVDIFTPWTVIGVSYYTFSAISYVVDVYKGTDEADNSLLDVAIWLSLFTKIIAGPIERHKPFKNQLNNGTLYCRSFENVKRGLLICTLGYFYKIVIADRISIMVDFVYGNLDIYQGIILFIVMILYSLQIYFDFAGYSLIAFGVSYVIGLRITKNFDHPYFSLSISEFWKRWHISLSGWLKDYVYIPLGGNRKGKVRQNINIMLTFLVSGIWHGTGLNYAVWGGLHGLFQVVERQFKIKDAISKEINAILTFLCVSFAWIFFRAKSLSEACLFIKRMFHWNPWVLTDGTLLQLGLDNADLWILVLALIISIVLAVLQIKGISLYNELQKKSIVVRWLSYYAIIVFLIVFGKYGAAYDASNFIYFKY